jgi:hypothetical protein
MPEALEAELRRRGRAKGYKGKRLDRYVYGALRATGWKPKRERKNSDRYR